MIIADCTVTPSPWFRNYSSCTYDPVTGTVDVYFGQQVYYDDWTLYCTAANGTETILGETYGARDNSVAEDDDALPGQAFCTLNTTRRDNDVLSVNCTAPSGRQIGRQVKVPLLIANATQADLVVTIKQIFAATATLAMVLLGLILLGPLALFA